MLNLPFSKLESKQIVIKQFYRKHNPFLVVATVFIVVILLIAGVLNAVPLPKTVLLIAASIVLLFAYLAKYGTDVHLFNLSTVKEAFIVAFVIAGFAVIASSLLYFVASIVLFVGGIILFGSVILILFFVVALLASVTFFLPLLMYIAVLSLIIYLLIWFFQSKPEKALNKDEEVKLNTDKLKKNLKDEYLD